MRVSSDQADVGYANFDPSYHYEITLDGMGVTNVITADEEEGYIVIADKPIRAVGGEIVKKMLYGVVVIDKMMRGI